MVQNKTFLSFFTTIPKAIGIISQGRGLGSSLTYDIVKAHGWELKAEMKELSGTTFTILLPMYLFYFILKDMCTRIMISILFFGFSLQTIGQDNCYTCNRDSLAKQLAISGKPEEKIQMLTLLIDFVPTSDSANRLIKQLLQLNSKPGKIYGEAYEKLYEANTYFFSKEYDSALVTYKLAVELFDNKRKRMPNLLLGFRNLFNLLNRQEERYKYYKSKLDYYLVNGPYENTAACYHGIGGYYTYTADYNQAISYYLKGSEVFKKFYPFWYFNALGIVGIYYAEWGNLEKASAYLNHALPLLDSLQSLSPFTEMVTGYYDVALTNIKLKQKDYTGASNHADAIINNYQFRVNDRFYAIGLLLKGMVHILLNEPDSAYPLLIRAKKLGDSLHSGRMTTFNSTLEIDYGLYKYYTLVKDYKLAEISLLQAYHTAVNETSNDLQLKYLKELSTHYLNQDQIIFSKKYTFDYFKLREKMEHDQNRFKVAEYENEKKQIDQLENINSLRNEKAKIQLQSKIRSLAFLAGIGVFLLIVFLLYRNNRTRRKANLLLQTQNKEIEQQKKNVEATLVELKATQTQLIQSEKMASLGELTAGIAHEIQNPLNFVNNFSEVNEELLAEMKDELDKGNIGDAKVIANDAIENQQKILHHGKRADAIVKGMLQHSRSSTGQKEPTDINVLADEYLRLAYHGLRAKDKSFNATIKTDFDESIGNINLIPQDIGRVILNLLNNAFYVVNERKKLKGEGFVPTVSITTKKVHGKVELNVKDNGNGIPAQVLGKIFHPFFTTKPTGQGTGLGLSLSYDIVKAHGGELRVESKEGEGSAFTVILP